MIHLRPPDGHLVRSHVAAIALDVNEQWPAHGPVEIDATEVGSLDSAGAALLAACHQRAQVTAQPFCIHGLQQSVADTLALLPPAGPAPTPPPRVGVLEHIGDATYAAFEALTAYALLCADVAYFLAISLLGRRRLRWRHVANEMASMGSQALPVVGLISFLVGATMALQSAAQLRQFGANIFVVDLIGVSITRELGPLMTAIVVAGRSGSAVAAGLATMVITEEIDALKTMGLQPVRYLVLPKFVAITLTQPVLTTLANIVGILGGFLVAITYLDIGPTSFVNRLEQALLLKDLLTGLFKSVIFAQLIVTIGAHCGLRTRGGADEVGRSTTTSVVASIFAVIVADAVCSLLFYFGG